MPEPSAVSCKLCRIVVVLALAHVVWGAFRLPGKAVQRRREDIARYEELGPVDYFLKSPGWRGREAIDFVLAHSEPESVVLYDGKTQGAIEFVPGALAPRLLVAVSAMPTGAVASTWAGLPIARARLGERKGAIVIVADETGLHVEVR